VWLQTWRRWHKHVEAEGMRFAPAPEYRSFPAGPGELGFYEAAERAARDSAELVAQVAPDVVVADILTLAPALAAEVQDVPWATLIPHLYPVDAPGLPIYSVGSRLPRSPIGRAFWEGLKAPMRKGIEQGRQQLNETRVRLGLPAIDRAHGGISQKLAIVATFPQLEYPRAWPANVRVVGPLMWEPAAADVELPRGRRPLVLVAPSTSQDRGQSLVRAALAGLADAPVRVLAALNTRPPGGTQSERGGAAESTVREPDRSSTYALRVPSNATVVEWVSYSQTMPHCDVVVSHAGHGTLVRALASGCPVVACPVAGDMGENAARLDWSGAGVRLPRRFVTARALRLAVERVLEDTSMRARSQALAAWSTGHDAPSAAAAQLEALIDGSAKLRGWDSNPQP
jgi:UDP:flavonoid glycosyltransferase YjiC (YdhE family)